MELLITHDIRLQKFIRVKFLILDELRIRGAFLVAYITGIRYMRSFVPN